MYMYLYIPVQYVYNYIANNNYDYFYYNYTSLLKDNYNIILSNDIHINCCCYRISSWDRLYSYFVLGQNIAVIFGPRTDSMI